MKPVCRAHSLLRTHLATLQKYRQEKTERKAYSSSIEDDFGSSVINILMKKLVRSG